MKLNVLVAQIYDIMEVIELIFMVIHIDGIIDLLKENAHYPYSAVDIILEVMRLDVMDV